MTAKELGETIRNTRKAQGLTQPKLAMACGTGVRFIVDLEAGKETCHLGKALLARLNDFLIGVFRHQLILFIYHL